jgi:uncharacterized protein YutD
VSDNVGDYTEEKLKLLKGFFTKKDIKVISCDKTGRHEIAVRYLLYGKETSEIIRLN